MTFAKEIGVLQNSCDQMQCNPLVALRMAIKFLLFLSKTYCMLSSTCIQIKPHSLRSNMPHDPPIVLLRKSGMGSMGLDGNFKLPISVQCALECNCLIDSQKFKMKTWKRNYHNFRRKKWKHEFDNCFNLLRCTESLSESNYNKLTSTV